jgi:hypothetical protein
MKTNNPLLALEYGLTVIVLFFYSTTLLELVLSGGAVQQNATVAASPMN